TAEPSNGAETGPSNLKSNINGADESPTLDDNVDAVPTIENETSTSVNEATSDHPSTGITAAKPAEAP
ncbi:hypothetical protein FRC01_001952, partial [Tulasnella sp. 417]